MEAQEIIVYVLVGLAAAVALRAGWRRWKALRRGRNCAGCAGCPLKGKCSKQP